MTKELYLESGRLEGEATIVEIISGDSTSIHLDETLFYPQGGGQNGDRGSIGELEVISVKHTLEGDVDHFVSGSVR